MSEHEKVEVLSRAELRMWLSEHHDQTESIWLVHHKKCSEHYLPYDEIVQEAICWGWIDSLPRRLDDLRTMHRLSPRKPGSNWSKRNKQFAKAAIDVGTMQSPGLNAIEQAKLDGSWNALDSIEAGIIPRDLEQMLNTWPEARANFDSFPKSVRRGILEWIDSAKTEATRIARIEDTARKASKNERANQFRS